MSISSTCGAENDGIQEENMMPVHMCVSKGERVVLLSLLVFASFVAGFVAFPMMLSAQDVSQPEVAFNESWFSQAPISITLTMRILRISLQRCRTNSMSSISM